MYDVCNEMCLKQGSKFGKSFPFPTSHTQVFCKLTLLRSRNRLNDHYLWLDHHFQIICILPWGFCATLASNGSQTGLYRISPSKKKQFEKCSFDEFGGWSFQARPIPCTACPFFLLSLFAILRTLVPRFCLAWPILRDARDMFLHIASPQEDRKVKSYFLTKHGMSCDLCLSLWGLL